MSAVDFDSRAFRAGVRSDRGVQWFLREHARADHQDEQDGENWNSRAHGDCLLLEFRVSAALTLGCDGCTA